MPEINGRQVVFYDTLEAGQWWPMMPTLYALQSADNPFEVLNWQAACTMIGAAVKSWEFDGEPGDPNAISRLDLMSEMMPLVMAIAGYISERSGQRGNSTSERTSGSD